MRIQWHYKSWLLYYLEGCRLQEHVLSELKKPLRHNEGHMYLGMKSHNTESNCQNQCHCDEEQIQGARLTAGVEPVVQKTWYGERSKIWDYGCSKQCTIPASHEITQTMRSTSNKLVYWHSEGGKLYQKSSSFATHKSFHVCVKSSKITTWTSKNKPDPKMARITAEKTIKTLVLCSC